MRNKVGPGPRPVRAHFIHTTLQHGVGKKVQNILFGPPLYKKLATALGSDNSYNVLDWW